MARLARVDELDGSAAVVVASLNQVSDRIGRDDLVSGVSNAATQEQGHNTDHQCNRERKASIRQETYDTLTRPHRGTPTGRQTAAGKAATSAKRPLQRGYVSWPVSSPAVGIFDSGVGGLSVLREIRSAMPAESLLYVADSANAPWGDKPTEYVRRRGLEIADFLVGQGVKAMVIGSNTGTAGAAEALRAKLTIPVVGMEPGIKPAAALTRSGVVGAIVTTTMGASDRMASLLDRFGQDVRVISVPAPGLVEHVEAADLASSELRRLVEGYVKPLLDAGADTIVLGSTHYVFLRSLIAAIAGDGVTIVDTGAAVARQLGRVLDEHGIAAPAGGDGDENFWTSADPTESARVMSALLGRTVRVKKIPI
jgi:glutamate racemase